MSDWLAVVNTRSGQFRSSRFEDRWMAALQAVAQDVVCTRCPGDASSIARQARGFDGVIAVGGDGTIFEVIEGMDLRGQKLAILPTGRGNCLARDLCIRSVADGFVALAAAETQNLDLSRVEVEFADGEALRFFSASTIALGYVVEVVRKAAGLRAAGAYGYALAAAVARPRPFSYRLAYEDAGDVECLCTGIVINNTLHLANFPAFLEAAVDDGLLDTLQLSGGWLSQTAHNVSILSGRAFYDPGVRRQAKRVSVLAATPQTLMIDGELYPNVRKLRVDCIPSALRCVTRA